MLRFNNSSLQHVSVCFVLNDGINRLGTFSMGHFLCDGKCLKLMVFVRTLGTKMFSFRDYRESLLLPYCNKLISDTPFFFLYDSYIIKNPDFFFHIYSAFSPDDAPDEAECKTEFRVLKQDVLNCNREKYL